MTRRLADVARKVGVSEATVSRVLNGKPGVSEATRQAVLTALDVLGYERPTKLRGERARLVGLVLPELQNPIFPAFAEVVGGGAGAAGLHPGAVHADGRRRVARRTTSSCCSSSRSPASSSPAACTPRQRRPARATTAGSPSAACRPCSSTRRSTASASRACRATTRSPSSRRWATSFSLGHTRIGLLLGPADHVPSERKLAARAGDRGARRASRSRPTRSPARCYSLEAAQAAADAAARAPASPASSAPATRWPSARSVRPGAPA